MSSEAFGFLSGFACVAVGGVVFYYLEIWRAIQRAHGRKPDGPRRGNALIWPSH